MVLNKSKKNLSDME